MHESPQCPSLPPYLAVAGVRRVDIRATGTSDDGRCYGAAALINSTLRVSYSGSEEFPLFVSGSAGVRRPRITNVPRILTCCAVSCRADLHCLHRSER
jgi:hypothetical protein